MRARLLAQRLGAAALGLGLGGAMILRYGGHPESHADHAAHHGGILGMVGDLHMEVVRRDGRIAVYVSDAYRNPLRATGGRLEFEDGPTVPLMWDGTRLTAADDARFDFVTCTVDLEDGQTVEMTAALPSTVTP